MHKFRWDYYWCMVLGCFIGLVASQIVAGNEHLRCAFPTYVLNPGFECPKGSFAETQQ